MSNRKTKILVLRKLSKQDIASIKNYKGSNSNVFSLKEYSNQLNNANILNIDAQFISSRRQSFYNTICDFGHENLKSKKIIEWLSFNKSTYWYYLRHSLYYHLLPVHLELGYINEFLSENSCDKLIIFSNNKHHIEEIECEFILNEKEKSTINPNLYKINYILLFLIRSFIGLYKHFFVKGNRNAILIEPNNQQNIIDIDNVPDIINGDYYNEYLTNEAQKNNSFLFISDFYPPTFKTKFKLRKVFFLNKYSKRSLYFEFYFILTILNPFKTVKYYSFRKEIKSNFKSLQSYTSSPQQKMILNFIRTKATLLAYIKAREDASQLLIKTKKIKTITCHHEHSYNHLSVINGAKKIGIPTIGFQHGVIPNVHIHYMYSKSDALYNPIPDFMITWGKHWENILTNYSIYSKKQIRSLGQTRTDVIPKLKTIEQKRKKKIVLASQPEIIGSELRRRIATDFLQLAKIYTNLDFVIKPHPGEKDAVNYFNEIALEVGTKNFSIAWQDLYLMINGCDALVTFHSTVAGEAIYFKKPVIILDYLQNDISNYSEYFGAIFMAKNFTELDLLINSIKNSSLIIDQNQQDNFIFNFANKIDGNVSKKYIEFIKTIEEEYDTKRKNN